MHYDAVAFLKKLYDPASNPIPDDPPESLPGDWHFRWDERAADLEREGMPRELAEHFALVEVARAMKAE